MDTITIRINVIMDKQVNKLIYILSEMIGVFEKLLLTANEKQKYMILLDMNSLERSTEDEGKLLDHMMVLEKSSRSILHEINRIFFNTNSLVLEKLVQLSKNDDIEGAENLSKVYSRLIDVTARLREVNDKNQNMANLSLEMVRDTVRFICKESTGRTTYKRSGRFDYTESLLSLIDTQV